MHIGPISFKNCVVAMLLAAVGHQRFKTDVMTWAVCWVDLNSQVEQPR